MTLFGSLIEGIRFYKNFAEDPIDGFSSILFQVIVILCPWHVQIVTIARIIEADAQTSILVVSVGYNG